MFTVRAHEWNWGIVWPTLPPDVRKQIADRALMLAELEAVADNDPDFSALMELAYEETTKP